VQLSGGVDSSLITALMDGIRRERGSADAVKSFSIGFDIPEYSELPYARQVAELFGTEHHEIVIGPDDFVKDLVRLCWHHDEPMGEPSAIPGYYMCQRAKEHVTVMLCGEGADEQFGGYSKYTHEALARQLDGLPATLRTLALRGLAKSLPLRARQLRSFLEIAAIPDESLRMASWAGGLDALDQQRLLSAEYRHEFGDGGLKIEFDAIMKRCVGAQALERFLYNDTHARLVGNILLKADRLSMAAGIEARVPFLDHTFGEFASSLPTHLKVRGLQRKVLLKQLAEKHLPRELIHRRKVGFNVPLGRWFAGPLAGVLGDVLLSDRALARGYFDIDALRRLVAEHVEQRVDRGQAIWILLALELWHRLYVDDDGSEDAVGRVEQGLNERALASVY
jgi:asparagine synthase (glutamine-hydrolysing)